MYVVSSGDFNLNKDGFLNLLFNLDFDIDLDNKKFDFGINDWKIGLENVGKPQLVSESINEVLNKFENNGLIKIEKDKIYIPNNKMQETNELIIELSNREIIINEVTKYLLKSL